MDLDYSTYAQVLGFSNMPTPEEYYPEVSVIKCSGSGTQPDVHSSAPFSSYPKQVPSEPSGGYGGVRWLPGQLLFTSSLSIYQCSRISRHGARTKASQGNDVPQWVVITQ
ncbi:uncharacterized protein LOC128253383 isoform X2 [Drosophila gunungcola]|uniref:uncharacterized protein LOC128253383 isoform X2 n=1 Tax=Drosophila gunungcola TaxID=103775 RepID=UPI0022E92B7B|nr:uncharacterized protein LOC128253383 isoform X2 [Drosophila gunungcola]